MSRTLLQEMVEATSFESLQANWSAFDLKSFSRQKQLWDYQQRAVASAVVGLWKYYEDFGDFVFAVVERYPDLKANDNFLALQHELANTEDRIQAARRFYNANVRDLNTRIEVFPSNLIAQMFSFQAAEFFEVEDAGIRAAPQVQL